MYFDANKKEIFQHPQPADPTKPLPPISADKAAPSKAVIKEAEKSSKVQGLNEQNSEGNAGAFEGFEDQEKK